MALSERIRHETETKRLARLAQLEREAAAWREVVEVVNKGMKYHATGCAVVMLVETYLRKESGNDKR